MFANILKAFNINLYFTLTERQLKLDEEGVSENFDSQNLLVNSVIQRLVRTKENFEPC